MKNPKTSEEIVYDILEKEAVEKGFCLKPDIAKRIIKGKKNFYPGTEREFLDGGWRKCICSGGDACITEACAAQVERNGVCHCGVVTNDCQMPD
ncbi:MAG: hypothetical protein LBR70_06690 [Lactobacillaceae bacterium]|nr:hypothetical protein [Lactobacillaceae bacterium]